MKRAITPGNPESVGRTTQIVTVALILGVVAFSCVAFAIANGPAPAFPFMSLFGLAFAAMTVVLRFMVPAMMLGAVKKSLAESKDEELMISLAGLYQSKTIVGMALLEGASLMNLVAYMSEKQNWTFGVVAFLLAVMAVSFPSQGQFESWAQEIKRHL